VNVSSRSLKMNRGLFFLTDTVHTRKPPGFPAAPLDVRIKRAACVVCVVYSSRLTELCVQSAIKRHRYVYVEEMITGLHEQCDYVSVITTAIHRVSKNVPPSACYKFDAHEWILIFFGINVTDKVSNQQTLYYATSNNLCFCTTCQNGETRKSHFSLNWIVLHTQCTCALSS